MLKHTLILSVTERELCFLLDGYEYLVGCDDLHDRMMRELRSMRLTRLKLMDAPAPLPGSTE